VGMIGVLGLATAVVVLSVTLLFLANKPEPVVASQRIPPPGEVRHAAFRRGLFGYRIGEVDEFLAELGPAYERLYEGRSSSPEA